MSIPPVLDQSLFAHDVASLVAPSRTPSPHPGPQPGVVEDEIDTTIMSAEHVDALVSDSPPKSPDKAP